MQVRTHEKRGSTHGGGGVRALSPQGAGSGGAVRVHGTASAGAALHRSGERGGAERADSEVGIRRGILPAPGPGGQYAGRRTGQRSEVAEAQRSELTDYN